MRRVRRRGTAGVAGCRKRDRPDAEPLRHRHRRREAARLEGVRRILSFLFDVQPREAQVVAETRRLQQRRFSFAERHRRAWRHHLFVAPHRRDAAAQRLERERAFRFREVVASEQRRLARGTEILRL